MSLNSVNIMGNLTRDPEIRYTNSGKSVCALSIANNRVFTQNGEKVQDVSYFDIDVWGPAGENCAKYLSKGSGVIIDGRLKQERWEKDGKTQSRVRIVANNVHFMPRRNDSGGGNFSDSSDSQGSSKPAAAASGVAWDE